MRKPFKIGEKEYKFKKDAIKHYRTILNSYDFGQSLGKSDLSDLNDLIDFNTLDLLNSYTETEFEYEEFTMNDVEEFKFDEQLIVKEIRIAKVQFNTKCFEVFYINGESEYISYLMLLNKSEYTPERKFNVACRNSIHSDIRSVKQEYFDQHSVKGLVKCQETGLLSKWIELVVDHRQPNTFSVIVDRFKELNKIELDKIEYTSNAKNQLIFNDPALTELFRIYHKGKASLRIVRAECNSRRSGLARIKRTTKDLTIL